MVRVVKTTLKVTMLALAGFGAFTLWKRYGAQFSSRGRDVEPPEARRVQERAELTAEEWAVGSDDPVAQATAILTESDERSRLPRDADGIEHRRSEDTVEPTT